MFTCFLLVGVMFTAPVHAGDLLVRNVKLVTAPGGAPIDGASIIIRDGVITDVTTDQIKYDGKTLDGGGRVATAGLWNCHVHFTDTELATNAPAIVRDMLLKYGFTSVVDTGSFLAGTQRLASAIDGGQMDGPRIVTANGSFVHTGGTPAYLPGIQLPEIGAPMQAAPAVNAVLDEGADGIKIFSGSFMAPGETIWLRREVIKAITDAAHARGSFVIAHPTDRRGFVNAVENGVDMLAHTAPPAGPLGEDLIASMIENKVALAPTLKLWSWELARNGAPPEAVTQYQTAGVDQLREYASAGGEVLFGTDVGYMRDYDTAEEFEMMARAGMSFDETLAALTTNPAKRFANESGRLEVGAPGDLAIYEADPTADVKAFARIAYTIRDGRIVYDGGE
jgi:imidazolonepropionase-like amidohydrolase